MKHCPPWFEVALERLLKEAETRGFKRGEAIGQQFGDTRYHEGVQDEREKILKEETKWFEVQEYD